MSTIMTVLTSNDFVEKAFIVLLTALLVGILAPLSMSFINTSKARNEAILQAQSKLWEEISATILTYETLALDVSWFKSNAARSEELYEKAFARYTEQVVDLVAQWRSQAARAQALVSPAISQAIDLFLLKVFIEQDTPINSLHNTSASVDAWQNQHSKSNKMLKEANDLIARIASDMGLSKKN